MASAAIAVSVSVRSLRPQDFEQWDEFVFAHPHGSPFHLTAWKKTIEESFGYRPVYLAATEGPRICGVLPLFYVRNPVIGKALISSPFAVYGGILAESPEVARRLYERAQRFGAKLAVDYLELRNAFPEQCVGEPNVSRYVTFVQDVGPDEEAFLAGLPKKTRNVVRKSLKQRFHMEYGVKDPANFDRVHSRNMRRLGTPCFPRRYLERLLANFGKMVDIREVHLGDEVVAVSLNFLFRGEMHTYHAAADTRYNALAPNTFQYYDHLCWAGRNGYKLFDFGRSKRDTGPFEFKKHWNTLMRELPYEIVLIRRKELPNFSPANPRFRLAIRAWSLLPLPVTRVASRFVLRLFP
ncbi:MAG: FemAB family PEP-CTERM system-associated protein [Acidobacteriia bacterium]|nr:FemAB family PEP-CTERM system-associated protein [Terriglobia bacterium]